VIYDSESDQERSVQHLKSLIRRLPPYNRFTLHHLFKFLRLVALHGDQNKMKSSNLAIVFGPNILCKKDANPFDCSDHKAMYSVVQLLLDHYDSIFGDLKIEEERQTFVEARVASSKDRELSQQAEKENKKNSAPGIESFRRKKKKKIRV